MNQRTEQQRIELASLKRAAEKQLLARGYSRRRACHEVAKLTPDELRRAAQPTFFDRLRGHVAEILS